ASRPPRVLVRGGYRTNWRLPVARHPQQRLVVHRPGEPAEDVRLDAPVPGPRHVDGAVVELVAHGGQDRRLAPPRVPVVDVLRHGGPGLARLALLGGADPPPLTTTCR